jgi:aspartate aminotransferase/aminotransferase
MAGWRMGFAAGPGSIMDKITTLQQFSFVCPPAPFQQACLKAFDVDIRPYIEAYKQKRDLIYHGLLDRGYKVHKPGGSFYIFPQVPWGRDQEFCDAAIQREVLIIPGSTFSNHNTHFRISFALHDEEIQRGLDILDELRRKKRC